MKRRSFLRSITALGLAPVLSWVEARSYGTTARTKVEWIGVGCAGEVTILDRHLSDSEIADLVDLAFGAEEGHWHCVAQPNKVIRTFHPAQADGGNIRVTLS